MAKVKVESNMLKVSNASDEARVYDICCTLNINNGEVTGIDSGTVTKDGDGVADFSKYGSNFSMTFREIGVKEYCDVIAAINQFVEDASTAIVAEE